MRSLYVVGSAPKSRHHAHVLGPLPPVLAGAVTKMDQEFFSELLTSISNRISYLSARPQVVRLDHQVADNRNKLCQWSHPCSCYNAYLLDQFSKLHL